MPANTVHEPYQLEDNFARALVAVLNADTVLGDQAAEPREAVAVGKSRLDVAALGFAKASERVIFAQGRWIDSHFSGPVAITVVTQRGGDGTAHAARVGRVRWLMSPPAAAFTATNLPWCRVAAIDQNSTAVAHDTATNTDRTELTFDVHLDLIPEAFP